MDAFGRDAEGAARGDFVTTHWTAVLAASNGDTTQAGAALDELCRAYWYPLYLYVRRRGHNAEDARDSTQEFFRRLIERKQLASVERGRAKFRAFLLGVMNHFLAHEWERARAQKRGGGQPLVYLDGAEAEERYKLEPADHWTPEKMFDRRWALTVLERANVRLKDDYAGAGKADAYEILKDFVSTAEVDAYSEVAERLGVTPSVVKGMIHRLRQRYHDLVRFEIAQTVTTKADIDDEIRYLLTVLRGE